MQARLDTLNRINEDLTRRLEDATALRGFRRARSEQ